MRDIAKHLLDSNDVKFPTPPLVVIKVNNVLNNPDSTDDELAHVLSSPSLLVRLLQVANSPALGARKISSIKDAVKILGRSMVRNIVICVSMREVFQHSNTKLSVRLTDLWHHHSEVAASSYFLAKHFRKSSDTAFAAGLLHDIGELPVLDYYGSNSLSLDTLPQIIAAVRAPLGNKLLSQWNFPDSMLSVTSASDNIPIGDKSYFDLVAAAHYDFDKDVERLVALGLDEETYLEITQCPERSELLSGLT